MQRPWLSHGLLRMQAGVSRNTPPATCLPATGALTKGATSRGSRDNITVLIVDLAPPEAIEAMIAAGPRAGAAQGAQTVAADAPSGARTDPESKDSGLPDSNAEGGVAEGGDGGNGKGSSDGGAKDSKAGSLAKASPTQRVLGACLGATATKSTTDVASLSTPTQ